MKPRPFPESNTIYTKPPGWTDEECGPMEAFADGKFIVSCFEPTTEEIEELIQNRKIWLFVAGVGMPPVAISTKHPFNAKNNPSQPV